MLVAAAERGRTNVLRANGPSGIIASASGSLRPTRMPGERRLRPSTETARRGSAGGNRQPGLQDPSRAIAQSRTALSLRAFPITLTDESAMAAAAMTGESRMPRNG